MRTVLCVGLVAMALLGSALPSEAWHEHGRGPVIVHPWGHVWVGPYPYPYPYYVPDPPVVVEPTPPPVYVEPVPQRLSYFCESPRGYYPEVSQCPGGWRQVVPPPAPGQ